MQNQRTEKTEISEKEKQSEIPSIESLFFSKKIKKKKEKTFEMMNWLKVYNEPLLTVAAARSFSSYFGLVH